MPNIVENFYKPAAAKPAPVTMPLIQWMNDPGYRRDYGMWLHQNFDLLANEYKIHGRFLTLRETQDFPLDSLS